MENTLLVVNKIVDLLSKGFNLERVQEHRLVFLLDNVEVAQLVFHDAEIRHENVELGLIQDHAIRFVLIRKLTDGFGSGIDAEAYVETDKDIEFFVNQVLKFVQMDEKEVNNFTFKYSNEV